MATQLDSTSAEIRATMRGWIKEAVDLYHRELAWRDFLRGGPTAEEVEWFRKQRMYTLCRWLRADWGMDLAEPNTLDQAADVLDEARFISARRRVKLLPRL